MTNRTVDKHAAHVASILQSALSPRSETIEITEALGRITHEPVASPVDLPLFRNSQMDGFAVRSADVASASPAAPVTLAVVGEIAARPIEPAPLEPNTAVRIMTGAVIPEGADAIVPVEDTTSDATEVTIARSRNAGEYVRERGSDVRAGDMLLPAGQRLGSRHLAVLAAAGLTTVEVRALVRVAIITTGSELIEPGSIPALGEVFDSNGIALAAAVTASGGVVASRVHVKDEQNQMHRALTDAAASADLIITSGGISMGDYEVVRETLEPLGAIVAQVAMQPGGPQVTAEFDGVPVLCFPGNPVSTQVSFEVFLAPLLRAAAGLPAAQRKQRALATGVRSVAGKRQFLRGRAVGDSSVELVAGPSSHLVAGLAASDLLVVIPDEITELAAGDTAETWEL